MVQPGYKYFNLQLIYKAKILEKISCWDIIMVIKASKLSCKVLEN